jgi:pilus assembly protein FimV
MGERIRTLVGTAVLLAMADVHALSLGSARGEAVVGQPLELAFDLAMDAGADVNSACVTAELFYGDTRVDASRVRIVTRQGSQPLQATVQLSSNVAVNEPVVSVLVRAGCSPAISRRFVLLSSSPVEAAGSTAAGVTALSSPYSGNVRTTLPAPSAPSVVVAPRSVVATASVRNDAFSAREGKPGASPAPVKAVAPRRSASPTAAVAATPAASRGARLELQSPVDWLQEQVLPLRSSTTMAEPPVTTTAEQRAAAAALWRSLGGAEGVPQGDVESEQRTQALEKQVKTLQNNARLSRGREGDLQNQLAEARSNAELFWLAIWSALGLVVAGGVLGGLMVWRRQGGRGMRWRRAGERSVFGAEAVTAYGEGFDDTQPAPVDFPYPTALPEAATGAPKPASVVQGFDEPARHSLQSLESGFGALSSFPLDEPATSTPMTSAEAATRAARELRNGSTNDLADVQQNADFFASLGQYEQAIELLQEYISSNPGTSPIAYLDLLKLFHTLSQTEPYRTLRTDFNAVFNADVPPFAAFLKGSKDLTAYNDVLQRISQAWSQASVLDLIESLLVRHSGEGAHPPFQLEAYRDLLLLYEIAKIEHGVDSPVKLAVPPGITPTHVPAPPTIAPVVAGSAAAAMAEVDQNRSAFRPDVSLERDREPYATEPGYPQLPASSGEVGSVADDLGIPLEFGSIAVPPELPRISLGDFAAPQTGNSSRSSEPSATDPHLIDFDMFDVALPPPPERPTKR